MDFPASLPTPLVAGYGIAPAPRVGRAAFEAGNQRVRRISASAPSLVTVRWRFTLAQMAVFEAWHANDIGHGADDFSVALANGLGMTTVTASFEEMYQPRARPGLRWDVSARLRVTGLPVMAANYLEAASAYNPNEIIASGAALHTLIHATLPAAYW